MRSHWRVLPFLVPALAAAFAAALPSASEAGHDLLERSQGGAMLRRDGDMHMHDHHAEPKIILNETEILLYHAPTPPSYYTIDFEDAASGEARYPGFMALHIVFMSLAFFGALPVGTSCPPR